MTLVLTYATPGVIIQVSDRRLTDLRTGKTIEDNSNKTVLFCNSTVFAYTGLAELGGGKRTDDWMLGVLADGQCVALGQAVVQLRDHATRRFRQLQLTRPEWKRHAFVFASWLPDGRRVVGLVTNSFEGINRWRSAPHDDFRVHGWELESNERG